MVIEQAGGKVVAIECKLKENPASGDASGLRSLAEAGKTRIKEKFIVCRTKVTYKLPDGTWVMNLPELLKNLSF
jgi:hypothetical protein